MVDDDVPGASVTRGPTRWLGADEQRTWRAYLESTRRTLDSIDRALSQEAGLPHAYYEILVRLSEAPERALRMSQLAEGASVSRSRLSHAVNRLEDKGWIRRDTCDDDRRGAIAVLTDEGFAVLAAAAPGHVECVRRALFDPLTAEQVEQLDGICHAILDGTAPVADPSCGAPPCDAPPCNGVGDC